MFQLKLGAILITTIVISQAKVCYKSQAYVDGSLQWIIDEQDPESCTSFLIGGLSEMDWTKDSNVLTTNLFPIGMNYKLLRSKQTFNQSRKVCQEQLGVDIAVSSSAQTLLDTLEMLNARGTSSSCKRVWLGIVRNSTENFQWLNGRPLQRNKRNDRLNNHRAVNQDCVAADYNNEEWILNDKQCKDNYCVLCHRKPK
ncbi:uncharacterized protein [Apostichopus japonicus]|uniref:uncharacterized protein n=1 Tax=Stichopus japonicus TaxID=307972 RepID=UPI003AB36ECF